MTMSDQRSKWRSLTIIAVVLLCAGREATASVDGHDCPTDNSTSRYDVLPGHGWDNLRNVEMLNVLEANFSKCRKSLDGRYYIPNHLEIIPKLRTNMELFSEVFDSFSSYRSLTANTINAEASGTLPNGVTIGGSFSAEHQEVRTNQINSQSITTRVQLRHHLYTALAGQGTPLAPEFRNRLLDIAFQLHSNNSRQADYLADLLVADYGTHVITRSDAGGILWQLDFVKTDGRDLSSSKTTQISASASVGFKMVFNLSLGISHKSSEEYKKGYHHNLTHQRVGSFGGVPMKPGISVDQWSDSVERRLVAIDRAGDPIYYVVSPTYLADTLPYQLVGRMRATVKAAVVRYYKANSIIGCMKPHSKNFDAQANIPSRDCEAKRTNFTLGGFFQSCHGPERLCSGHRVDNIMTGGQSCPKGYVQVLLTSRTFVCGEFCRGYFIWTKCTDKCARYAIYWCAAKSQGLPPSSGYLFGGLYTRRANNPITGQKTCPPTFLSFLFGNGDITLCVSRDFELSSSHQLSFGGFFSCNAGNPYTVLPALASNGKGKPKVVPMMTVRSSLFAAGADKWPKACPRGFSQHLGFVDAGCEMLFCSRTGFLRRVESQRVQRPPFVLLPAGSVPKPRASSNLKLRVDDGVWTFDNEQKTWRFEKRHLTTTVAVLGTIVGLTCLAAVAAVLVLARRRYLGRQNRNEYQQLQDTHVETADSRQVV